MLNIRCQGNLRVCMFLSPKPKLHSSTYSYYHGKKRMAISYQQNRKSMQVQKQIEKEKKIKNSNSEKSKKTYLFAEKGVRTRSW